MRGSLVAEGTLLATLVAVVLVLRGALAQPTSGTIPVGLVAPFNSCDAPSTACDAVVGTVLGLMHASGSTRVDSVVGSSAAGRISTDVDFAVLAVDSEDDPHTAVSGYLTTLRSSDVGFVIGGFRSEVSKPLAIVAASAGHTLVSASASAESLSDPHDFPQFARTVPTDGDLAVAALEVINAAEWQTVAVIGVDDESGRGLLDELFARLNAAGVTAACCSTSYTPGDATEMAAVIAELDASEARAVIAIVSDDDAEAFFTAGAAAGVVGTDGGLPYSWILIDRTHTPWAHASSEAVSTQLKQWLLGAVVIRPAVPSGGTAWDQLVTLWGGLSVAAVNSRLPAALALPDNYFAARAPSEMTAFAYDTAWLTAIAAAEVVADGAATIGTGILTDPPISGVVLRVTGEQVFGSLTDDEIGIFGASGTLKLDATGERVDGTIGIFRVADGGSVERLASISEGAPGLSAPIGQLGSDGLTCVVGEVFAPITTDRTRCTAQIAVVLRATEEDGVTPKGNNHMQRSVAAMMAVEHVTQHNTEFVEFAERGGTVPDDFHLRALVVNAKDSAATTTGAVLPMLTDAALGRVAGIVGSLSTSITIGVSPLSAAFRTPLISASATGALLSDKGAHATVARVVPSDSHTARGLAFAMKFFGFERVGVLTPLTSFGSSYATAFRAACSELDISVESPPPHAEDDADAARAAVDELKALGVRIFLMIDGSDRATALEILLHARRVGLVGDGFGWFVTDALPLAIGDDPDVADILNGFVLLQAGLAESDRLGAFQTMWAAEGQRRSHWEAASRVWVGTSKSVGGVQLGEPALELEDAVFSEPPSAQAMYTYDAVWLVALSLMNSRSGTSGEWSGTDLYNEIVSTSFAGLTGVVELDSNGDRALGTSQFSLRNVRKKAGGGVVAEEIGFWAEPEDDSSTGIAVDRSQVVWPSTDGAGSARTPSDGTCPAGYEFNVTTLACDVCLPGSYKPLTEEVCSLCAPGSVASAPGAAFCVSCDESGGYASDAGATECSLCPRNSARSPGSAAVNITECLCVEGTYSTSGKPGEACSLCPEGATCAGGLATPRPKPGWWASEHRPELLFECEFGERACPGSNYSACSVNYEGNICSECALDGEAYLLGSSCNECPDEPVLRWLLVVFGIAAVVAAFYALNNVAAGGSDVLDMGLLFAQITAHVQEYSVSWPSVLGQTEALFKLANFDAATLSPACVLTLWTADNVFLLQFAIPTFACVFYIALYSMASLRVSLLERARGADEKKARSLRRCARRWQLCWTRFCCTRLPDVRLEAEVGDSKSKRDGDLLASASKRAIVRAGGAADDEVTSLEVYGDNSIAGSLGMIVACYNAVALGAASAFMCEDMPTADGSDRQWMRLIPSVECWTVSHTVWFVLPSIVLFAVFVIGVPVVLSIILVDGFNRESKGGETLFAHPKFFRRFGFLYSRYERKFYFYELVLLARRLLITLPIAFLAKFPMLQGFVGLTLLTGFGCLHVALRPFAAWRVDLAEFLGIATAVFYMFCGLMFEANVSFKEELAVCLVVVVWSVIVTFLVLTFQDAIAAFSRFLARDSLVGAEEIVFGTVSRGDGGLGSLTVAALEGDITAAADASRQLQHETSIDGAHESKRADAAADDIVRSQTLTFPSKASFLQIITRQMTQRTLSRVHEVHASTATLKPAARVKKFGEWVSGAGDFGEPLLDVLDAWGFAAWVNHLQSKQDAELIAGTELYIGANKLLGEHVQDDSDFSRFKNDLTTVFFEDLFAGKAGAALLNWLVKQINNNGEHLAVGKEIIAELAAVDAERVGGGVAALVLEEYRAPIGRFLLDAPRGPALVVAALFEDMYGACLSRTADRTGLGAVLLGRARALRQGSSVVQVTDEGAAGAGGGVDDEEKELENAGGTKASVGAHDRSPPGDEARGSAATAPRLGTGTSAYGREGDAGADGMMLREPPDAAPGAISTPKPDGTV